MRNKTNNKSASRRRARRAGVVAMLLAGLLTPAGTIVAGAAVTALLVGSVVVGTRDVPTDPESPSSTAKARPAPSPRGADAPYVIPIEHDGETLLVALAEPLPDAPGSGFAPPPARFVSPGHAGGAPGTTSPAALPASGPELPPGPRLRVPPAADAVPGESDPDRLPSDPPHPGPRGPETKTEPSADDPPPGPGDPHLPPNETLPNTSLPPTVSAGGEPPAQREATRHAVPEPSVWGLLLLGGAALALARRRRAPARPSA